MSVSAPPTSAYLAAPNRTVDAANGVDYAYRDTAARDPARPSPALPRQPRQLGSRPIDALAEPPGRHLRQHGVGGSSGNDSEHHRRDGARRDRVHRRHRARRVDVLGFSIGSFVAQEIALVRPSLVRRLVLASSAPQGAAGMHGWAQDVIDAVGNRSRIPTGTSPCSSRHPPRVTGRASRRSQRMSARTSDRDEPTAWQTRLAQYDAVCTWGMPNHAELQRVSAIDTTGVRRQRRQRPDDPAALLLPARRPDPARTVKIYPDAAHGFLFQHHAEFATDVDAFLTE